MVQHRRRPDDNRRDCRRRLHDHRRGGGAHWRAGKPISTEWAIHRFADRNAHQPDARPGASPGLSGRPDRKPDRADAGPAVAHHPAGAVKRSDLHTYLHSDLHAELSGADHRAEFSGAVHGVELGRAVHHYIDHIGTLAQHHPRAGRDVTAKG
jgi:hypothetical protein